MPRGGALLSCYALRRRSTDDANPCRTADRLWRSPRAASPAEKAAPARRGARCAAARAGARCARPGRARRSAERARRRPDVRARRRRRPGPMRPGKLEQLRGLAQAARRVPRQPGLPDEHLDRAERGARVPEDASSASPRPPSSARRSRASTCPSPAKAAGTHTVTANVKFAVCTPENCVPDERTLAVVLPVE